MKLHRGRPARLALSHGPLLLAGLFPSAPLQAQASWYVDDDALPGGNGSLAQPFRTITEGIGASVDGDRVLVLAGTYDEEFTFLGKDITVRGVEGAAATVIVSGGGRPVAFQNGETRACMLEDVTIERSGFFQGGAILCSNAGPTIRRCVIDRNSTIEPGGGIALVNSSALIQDCRITRNSATPGDGRGGGLYISDSDVELVGNLILENNAFSDPDGLGGGLYIQRSRVLLAGNVIAGNFVTDNGGNVGGGIFTTGSCQIEMYNNVVADNVATSGFAIEGTGGGISFGLFVTAFMRNNVLWGNMAVNGPQLANAGTLDADFNVFEGGAPAISGSGSVLYGPSNSSADPLFVNAAARDYHVLPSSPVVDAGSNVPPGGTDGDLDPRRLDGNADGVERIDIGWDEVNPTVFEVVGAPAIGTSIALRTTAPAGQVFFHLLGFQAVDVPLQPFGSLLVAGPLLRAGSGVVPGATDLALPADPGLIGLELFLQSLARTSPAPVGAFSRRVPLRIQ